MAAIKVERREYSVASLQLFGACVAALSQLRGAIEHHDVEHGTLVAAFGEGPLGPVSELSLTLRPLGAGRTELAATWRARKRGGDRRLLAAFFESVDALIASQAGSAG
jgi:hypothetical protein